MARWNAHVRDVARKKEPNLIDLLHWLKDQVDADFNPYAVPMDRTRIKSQQPYLPSDSSRRNQTTLNVSVKQPAQQNQRDPPSEKVVRKCPICSEDHLIYKCAKFLNVPVSQRQQFVHHHKLCSNCLKPNHASDNCFSNIWCRDSNCNAKHHTLLHVNTQVETIPKVTVNASSRKLCQNVAHFQIVSVMVYGKNGCALPTYALLDSASEVTMIHTDLAEKVGVKGAPKTLIMNSVSGESTHKSEVISLRVRDKNDLDAETVYIKDVWTVSLNTFADMKQYVQPEWIHVQDLNIPDIHPQQVKMLIGINVPKVHIQSDIRVGRDDQPIAVRTVLGWSLLGTTSQKLNEAVQAKVNLIVQQDVTLHEQIEQFAKTESFGIIEKDKIPTSVEDRHSLQILENTTQLRDDHYEIGMLWKNDTYLPCNIQAAQQRYYSLMKRLQNNPDMKATYTDTLNSYVEKGYAKKLTRDEIPSDNARVWYLPHHGVTNPNKPGKIRVVFDAAAKYHNTSLNANLMAGPDLLNSLFGVLLRFRLRPVALVADIEAMFHQVRVPQSDSESLRFLWKEDLTTPGPPDVYKMNVHIFGPADSPCCANYAIQRTAEDNKRNFSSTAVNIVQRDFYVDDLITSVDTTSTAIQSTRELSKLLHKGGFHLHKWISNSHDVMKTITNTERAITDVDLELDNLPVQRTLGLKWNVTKDAFVFMPKLENKVDPCGFLSPFVLRAKCVIQELWRKGLDWDDTLPYDMQLKWTQWLSEVEKLNTLKIPRHHTALTSNVQQTEIHMFSDASERGFGAVAYLRYTSNNNIVCSFIAAKSRVAPIKPALSIPRLELQGALLVVRLWNSVKCEIDIPITKTLFWTD